MTRTTAHAMTDRLSLLGRASSRSLLARVLETPDLAAQIEALEPPALMSLIDRVGLEDAGELVAFATTEQLAHLFDRDLWRSESIGEDETFDADRFPLWLNVMLEAGDAFVAEKLVTLPEDLVTLAFHTQILVIPLEGLTRELEAGDDEARATEKALASCLAEEVDEYQLIARRHEGWDDVLTAILALDRDHHDYLARLLGRCAAMSAEVIDDGGGLYDVLTSERMLEEDVAGDREDRRAEAGHVAPSSAVAFLKLARHRGETPFTEHDPMTRAYFRGLGPRSEMSAPPKKTESTLAPLLRALAAEGKPGAHPRLESGARAPEAIEIVSEEEPLLARTIRQLHDEEPKAAAARSEELAYLANVLAAGASFRGRRFRPAEAVQAALAVVSVGLALSVQSARKGARLTAIDVLRRHPADALFRLAWNRMHEEVAKPAAIVAECTLRAAAMRASAGDAAALVRSANRIRAVGEIAPWKALDALDAGDGLVDAALLEALRGLMDECPQVTAALVVATHEKSGRGGGPSRARSTPAFEGRFIASAEDLARATRFLGDRARLARTTSG